MRTLRLLSRPWFIATLAGLAVTGAVEAGAGTGPAGFGAAALGALTGVVLLPMLTHLGLLTGSAVFGLRIKHVVLGATRRLATWRTARTTFTLRLLPVVLASEIAPRRTPVILRCWLAGLTSAATGFAGVVLGWALADGPFGRGLALAVTALMTYKMWPQRVPMTTSTGWLLFGLPRLPEQRKAEFRAAPLANRVQECLTRGTSSRHRPPRSA